MLKCLLELGPKFLFYGKFTCASSNSMINLCSWSVALIILPFLCMVLCTFKTFSKRQCRDSNQGYGGGNRALWYLTLQFCTSTFLTGGSCHAAGLAEPAALPLSPLSTLAHYLPGGILEAVRGFQSLFQIQIFNLMTSFTTEWSRGGDVAVFAMLGLSLPALHHSYSETGEGPKIHMAQSYV